MPQHRIDISMLVTIPRRRTPVRSLGSSSLTTLLPMNTIVVGAAATATASLAITRAAEMAVALDARVVVVTAFRDDNVESFSVGSDRFVVGESTDASQFAEQTAQRIKLQYGVEATSIAGSGKPEDVIIETARQLEATLIVVGNLRMQGPGRLLGSVANHVAHHAPCDVLIVKTS